MPDPRSVETSWLSSREIPCRGDVSVCVSIESIALLRITEATPPDVSRWQAACCGKISHRAKALNGRSQVLCQFGERVKESVIADSTVIFNPSSSPVVLIMRNTTQIHGLEVSFISPRPADIARSRYRHTFITSNQNARFKTICNDRAKRIETTSGIEISTCIGASNVRYFRAKCAFVAQK